MYICKCVSHFDLIGAVANNFNIRKIHNAYCDGVKIWWTYVKTTSLPFFCHKCSEKSQLENFRKIKCFLTGGVFFLFAFQNLGRGQLLRPPIVKNNKA
jgi:hypothetical protein